MATRGRPNATGRSSGKMTGRRGRLMRPPKGEPFVWLTRELLESPAWRSLGINARRFIEFLLIEHMNHRGAENGRLKAPYRQLEKFGIPSRHISDAIRQAIAHGLVVRTNEPDDPPWGPVRRASTYALTWYPTADGEPATNGWKNWSPPPEGKVKRIPKGRQMLQNHLPQDPQMPPSQGNALSISRSVVPD